MSGRSTALKESRRTLGNDGNCSAITEKHTEHEVFAYAGGILRCLLQWFRAEWLTVSTKLYMLRSLKPGVVVNAA